jgi:hypothetical protein
MDARSLPAEASIRPSKRGQLPRKQEAPHFSEERHH